MRNLGVNVRFADNTKELQQHLREGLNSVDDFANGFRKYKDAAAQALQDSVTRLGTLKGAVQAADAEIRGLQKAWREANSDTVRQGIAFQIGEASIGAKALRIQLDEVQQAVHAGLNLDTAPLRDQLTLAGRATGVFTSAWAGLVSAFSVAGLVNQAAGALIGLAKDAISSAGALVDLSTKTGLTTETLQRFTYVGKQTGVTVDEFADAAFKLGVRLDGGSGSVRKAVDALGLSYKELKALKPDDQFNAIVAALERMENPQERNRLAVELFGKGAAKILPAIAEGYTKIAKEATIASDAQLKAIDAANDRWDAFIQNTKTGITAWLGNFLLAQDTIKKLTPEQASTFQALNRSGGDSQGFLLKIQRDLANAHDIELPKSVTKSVESYTEQLRKATAEVANLTAEQKKDIAAAEKLGESADKIADHFGISEAALRVLNGQMKDATKGLSPLAQAWREYAAAGEDVRATVDALDGATVEGIKFDLQRGLSQETLQRIYGVTAGQIKAIVAVQKLDIEQARDTLRLISEAESAARSLRGEGPDFLKGLGMAHLPGLPTDRTFEKEAITANQGLHGEGTNFLRFLQIDKLPGISVGLTLGQQLQSGLTKSLDRAPQLLVNAFTGGGGARGAFQALGTDIGATIGGTIGKSISSAITGIGSLAGPLGQAVGSLLGPLVGWIAGKFGPSQAELSGRKTVADFEAQLASTLTKTQKLAAGGESWKETVIAVRDAYLATGRSEAEAEAAAQRLWASSTKGAAEQQAAIAAINTVLEEQTDLTKRIADANTELAGLLRTGQTIGAKLPAALQPVIQQLIDMGRITGDNATLLKSMMSGTDVDFKKLESIADKYGKKLESLGPKFKQAKLNDTAKTVINDFDELERGLGDVDLALTVMVKPINDLVNESLKAGTTLPANMKPWVDQLKLTHQLVDENGDELTDIGGLKFADPIVTEFDKLMTSIQELIDTLKGPLPDALTHLPKPNLDLGDTTGAPRPAVEDFRADSPDVIAARGGIVHRGWLQRFGAGGRVQGWAPLTGTDTVIGALTPGELVSTASQQGQLAQVIADGAAMADLLRAGGGRFDEGAAGTNVQVEIHAVDAASFEDLLRRSPQVITDAVLKAVRTNRGGAYSQARSALNLTS